MNASNIVPSFIATIEYAHYIDLDSVNQWGTFKWGAGNKWGSTTKYSAGQKLPAMSTVEI